MPQDVAEALLRLQRRLGFGRPVPQDNLHLTLAFLDDQPEELLEDLHEELSTLRAAPFTIELAGLGVFGTAIHVPASDNPNLTALYDRITSACRRVGIPLQRRRFRPHVTLARLGKGQSPPPLKTELSDFQIPALPVTQVALYHSILHPKGARHEELASYQL
ncbi:MAG: RNA 2',3'-cyclic phosphodiesterase [Rhodobacteraceae bacterium]|nr:RNA 2',3'-cyclic phosphodiesterase [Paracoccaceae bacterium]